jgi:tetratricopeptide (TPR) repeat protein
MGGVALVIVLVLAAVPSPASASSPQAGPDVQPAPCAAADAALAAGDLSQARAKYLDALASGGEECAVPGLKQLAREDGAVAKLCAQGKALAAEGHKTAANRRYAAALRLDGKSECATKGLEPKKAESKDEKGWVARAAEWTTELSKLLGTAIAAVLLGAALLLIAILIWRRRKPSLAIEPFADGAVEPKVGAAVAGLVEGHLTAVGDRKGQNDGLLLDLVVADTELMATNKDLETALKGLAEVSQLKLLVAVVGLADRLRGTHLVAKGELAPAGQQGHGVVVALQSEKDGLEARTALWRKDERPRRQQGDAKDPTPYYDLAEPAAAWIQFETACSLDGRVRFITRSAHSFSLLAQGVAAQRKLDQEAAAEHYAAALRDDPENVAALLNLGRILIADERWFAAGVLLLVRALVSLESRYEEIA